MAAYRMQAVDSVDGQVYRWTTTEPDFAAANYPGPNAATHVAVLAVAGATGGGGGGGGESELGPYESSLVGGFGGSATASAPANLFAFASFTGRVASGDVAWNNSTKHVVVGPGKWAISCVFNALYISNADEVSAATCVLGIAPSTLTDVHDGSGTYSPRTFEVGPESTVYLPAGFTLTRIVDIDTETSFSVYLQSGYDIAFGGGGLVGAQWLVEPAEGGGGAGFSGDARSVSLSAGHRESTTLGAELDAAAAAAGVLRARYIFGHGDEEHPSGLTLLDVSLSDGDIVVINSAETVDAGAWIVRSGPWERVPGWGEGEDMSGRFVYTPNAPIDESGAANRLYVEKRASRVVGTHGIRFEEIPYSQPSLATVLTAGNSAGGRHIFDLGTVVANKVQAARLHAYGTYGTVPRPDPDELVLTRRNEDSANLELTGPDAYVTRHTRVVTTSSTSAQLFGYLFLGPGETALVTVTARGEQVSDRTIQARLRAQCVVVCSDDATSADVPADQSTFGAPVDTYPASDVPEWAGDFAGLLSFTATPATDLDENNIVYFGVHLTPETTTPVRWTVHIEAIVTRPPPEE